MRIRPQRRRKEQTSRPLLSGPGIEVASHFLDRWRVVAVELHFNEFSDALLVSGQSRGAFFQLPLGVATVGAQLSGEGFTNIQERLTVPKSVAKSGEGDLAGDFFWNRRRFRCLPEGTAPHPFQTPGDLGRRQR